MPRHADTALAIAAKFALLRPYLLRRDDTPDPAGSSAAGMLQFNWNHRNKPICRPRSTTIRRIAADAPAVIAFASIDFIIDLNLPVGVETK